MNPKRVVLGLAVALFLAVSLSAPARASLSVPPSTAFTPHGPIRIVGDANFTAANGMVSGSGAPGDPFVVRGWAITVSTWNPGLLIQNTSAYFVVDSLSFNFTIGDPEIGSPGAITLINVSHGVVRHVISEGQGNFVQVSNGNDVAVLDNQASNVSTSSMPGGIVIGGSSLITVAGNKLTNTAGGVSIDGSKNVSVIRNLFIGDGSGVGTSSHVTIAENNFSGGQGVSLSDNTNISVYHNNFFGPGIMGSSWTLSPNNSWDDGYPSGGNYWYNYTGVDRCSGPAQNICTGPDGIGDTPLVVGDSHWIGSWYGIDRYPLMRPLTLSPGNTPSFAMDFTWAPRGLTATFTSSVSGGTPPYRYLWDFGDGNRSVGASPVHTYARPGTYPVTVTVTDSLGQTANRTLLVSVGSLEVGPVSTLLLVLGVAAVAAAAFAIVFAALWLRQRRRQAPPSNPGR